MKNQETSQVLPEALELTQDSCTVCDTGRAAQAIQELNRHCFCLSLPEGALKQALKERTLFKL